MAIKYANKNDLIRFSITVTEAKINHITKEDLSGITEIISNEKYRIFISNGYFFTTSFVLYNFCSFFSTLAFFIFCSYSVIKSPMQYIKSASV